MVSDTEMSSVNVVICSLCMFGPVDQCSCSMELVKNPWVHGLNKSRVPSHNGGTIYRVAI